MDVVDPNDKEEGYDWEHIRKNLIVPKEREKEWIDVLEYAMNKHRRNKNRNPSVVDWGSVGMAAVKNAGKEGLW